MKIIIIGATSGIGKELATGYLKKGFPVGITGRRDNLLQEAKSAYPSILFTSCFDVTGTENIQHLKALIADLGGLDLLIYNAGYGEPSTALVEEVEINTTKTNVTGFVEIVGFAFNYFVNQGHGQIALTSSVAALRGNHLAPAYSASKAFISNYAEGLNGKASRLKKEIFITDIKPGFVNTNMAKGHGRFWVASPQKAAGQIMKAIAKKRRIVYITRRWWLIAQLLKIIPYPIYRRIG